MVVAAGKIDSVVEVHPDVILAVVRFSQRQATLAAACLDGLVAAASRRGDEFNGQDLPLGFLLELGAIAQLQWWDSAGLRPLMPIDVPTVGTAVGMLKMRVRRDPQQFKRDESAVLSSRLLNLWLERFSWSAPALLDADVTFGEADEDALVEAMAQLLWKHRRNVPETNS